MRQAKPGVRAQPGDQMAPLSLKTVEDLLPRVVAIADPVEHFGGLRPCENILLIKPAKHVDHLFEVEVHPGVGSGSLRGRNRQSRRGLRHVKYCCAAALGSDHAQKRHLQSPLRPAGPPGLHRLLPSSLGPALPPVLAPGRDGGKQLRNVPAGLLYGYSINCVRRSRAPRSREGRGIAAPGARIKIELAFPPRR